MTEPPEPTDDVPPATAGPATPQDTPAYGTPLPMTPGPYQPAPGYPAASTAGAPLSPSDERMWALFAHLGGVLVSFIVPLVIYLVYKDRSEFVRDQAAEALNWQITLFIAGVISVILIIVLIGLFMLLAIGILAVVFGIIAAIAANRGERYRYPFAIRLVS